MKNFFLLSLMLFISCLSYAQKFTLKGDIKGIKTTNVSGLLWNPNAIDGSQRFEFDKDMNSTEFIYSDTCSLPCVVRLFFDDNRLLKTAGSGYFPTKSMYLWAVVYPGADLKAVGEAKDFPNTYIRGDYENDQLANINSKVFPLMNESLNIQVELSNANVKEDDERVGKAKELSKRALEIQKEEIGKNPSSIAALWYLDDMLLRSQISVDEVETLLLRVDKKYHSHPYYKTLRIKVNGAKSSVVGANVPDVRSSLSYDGKEFDLRSLRGKYIIIDFWGTWCGACVAGMPEMKAYRDKYRDKVEILGIAKDRSIEVWRQYIKDNWSKMDWIHLFNGKGEENFVEKFNVQGYPTKLIISPEGKIVYRASGESDEFYKILEDLLTGKK